MLKLSNIGSKRDFSEIVTQLQFNYLKFLRFDQQSFSKIKEPLFIHTLLSSSLQKLDQLEQSKIQIEFDFLTEFMDTFIEIHLESSFSTFLYLIWEITKKGVRIVNIDRK